MGLWKICNLRNCWCQSKYNKLSAAATQPMLCLCHCNGDFAYFNMAGNFQTLPHVFLPQQIRPGLTWIKNGEDVLWKLTRGFIRKDTIQKIPLYLGKGRPTVYFYKGGKFLKKLWCTSVHYKPTDSHSHLLYSSSHPSHVKNSIPYAQLLRLRRLCSEDLEEMCHFFDKRGYPASVVQAGHHRAQRIDRQSALQPSQKENNNRIPFTLTFQPHNHSVKSIII